MNPNKYFFEQEIYSDQDFEFQFEYDEELIEKILILKDEGKVLDIGCGEGGNALVLAEFGFEVDAIDISKTAIKNIKKEAKKRKLKVNAIASDLENYKIKKQYDIIISTGVLHFLEKNNVLNLINQIKNNTNKSGLNFIETLLDEDVSQDDNPQGYYFRNNELKQLYSNWEILDYEEYDDEYDIEDEDYENKLARIISRKL